MTGERKAQRPSLAGILYVGRMIRWGCEVQRREWYFIYYLGSC